MIGNRYRITEEIEKTGLYIAYKAEDQKTGAPAIVYVPLKQELDSESLLRFKKEAETMAAVSHPNIAKILGYGAEKGALFLAAEFCEGARLPSLISGGKIAIDQALDIIYQISKGLAFAHQQGILHQNLNSGSIVIHDGQIKIYGFCLSKVINIANTNDQETIINTFSYMSPEQAGITEITPDERSDLYSLGIIFYELLAGDKPFKEDDLGFLLEQQISKVPKRPKEINPKIPDNLENIALKLLEKLPGKRYQSAKGLLSDLAKAKNISEEFEFGADDQSGKISYQTRFIGRKKELQSLKEHVQLAKEGQGQLCLVSGSAGMGKTRLINEIVGPANLFSGKCNKYGALLPYYPFIEALNEYIGAIEKKNEAEKTERIAKIKEALGELGGVITQVIPSLKNLLGEMPQPVKLEPDREKNRFFNVLLSFFKAISKSEDPPVIFLDDLQWADWGTIELLRFLTPNLPSSNLLLLGSFRSEDVEGDHPLMVLLKEFHAEIRLEPFSMEKTSTMITEVLGYKEKAPPELLIAVYERSKGNPFFTIQLLRSMVENKIISRKENNWAFDPKKINETTAPDSMIDLLLGRIRILTPKEATILSCAAAIGSDFDYETLLSITKTAPDNIIVTLDKAADLMFIWSTAKNIYTFSHDKIREALYEKIDPPTKRWLHEEIALYLENKYILKIDSLIYELAHNYYEGMNKEKAFEYSVKAGDRARAVYANEEVIRFYTRALDLMKAIGADPDRKIVFQLKEGLGDTYSLMGEFNTAIKYYSEAEPFAGTTLEKLNLFEKEGYVIFSKGNLPESIKYYEKGLLLVKIKIPASFPSILIMLVWQTMIQMTHTFLPFLVSAKKDQTAYETVKIMERLVCVLWFLNTVKCLAVHLFGINLAERFGPSRILCQVYSDHGIAISVFPLFKRALRYQLKSYEIAQKLNDPWNIALSQSFLGLVHYYMQEWDKSIDWLKKATYGFDRIGDPWNSILAQIHLGYDYRNKSDFEEAAKYLKKAFDLSYRIKDIRSMGQALSGLCEVLAYKGELEAAEKEIEKAVGYCEQAQDLLVLAMALRDHAKILMLKGDIENALLKVQKSRELIAKHLFRSDYCVPTYLILADLYLKSGNTKKAWWPMTWGFILALSFKNYLGYAYRVRGVYCCLKGKPKKGIKYLDKSAEILAKQGNNYELELTKKAKLSYAPDKPPVPQSPTLSR